VGSVFRAEGLQGIVPQRALHQAQQVVGKTVAGVLAVEREGAARIAGGMPGKGRQMVKLIADVYGVGSANQGQTRLSPVCGPPKTIWHAEGRAEAGITSDPDAVRQTLRPFAAGSGKALNAGLLRQIVLADAVAIPIDYRSHGSRIH